MSSLSCNNSITEFIIDKKGDEAISNELTGNLNAFNEKIIGPYKRKKFNIYTKIKNNKIIAGISGNILNDLCYVTIFWVDEAHRRKKIGTKLQLELEKHAQNNDCKNIQLETGEFQAKDFYLKLGYETIATIRSGFMGYDYFIMRKALYSEG